MENPIKMGWFLGKTHYFRKYPPSLEPVIFAFFHDWSHSLALHLKSPETFFRNHFLKSSVNNYHNPHWKTKIKQQHKHTNTQKNSTTKNIPRIFNPTLLSTKVFFKPNNQPTHQNQPRTTLRGHPKRSPPWAPPVAAVRHTAPWRTSSESPFRRHGLSSDGTQGGRNRPMDGSMEGMFFSDPEQKTQILLGVRMEFLDDRIFLDGIFYVFVHKTMKILRDT